MRRPFLSPFLSRRKNNPSLLLPLLRGGWVGLLPLGERARVRGYFRVNDKRQRLGSFIEE